MLTRLSIRVLAPVLLVLPVVLVAGVLIAIGTVQGRAAVHRLASQQLGQIHDQIGERVEGLVSLPGRANRVNIALIEEGRLDPEALRQWGPVLVEQFRAFEDLSAITWGDERGRCTWVARYDAADDHLFYAVLDGESGSEIVEYREMIEELGVHARTVGEELGRFQDEGSEFLIHFLQVQIDGTPIAHEHQAIGWFLPEEARRLALAPADRGFVDSLVGTDQAQ